MYKNFRFLYFHFVKSFKILKSVYFGISTKQLQYPYLLYFSDYKIPPPQIWEEKGCVSYSPNVAYLASLELGGGATVEPSHRRQEQDHIFA